MIIYLCNSAFMLSMVQIGLLVRQAELSTQNLINIIVVYIYMAMLFIRINTVGL